MRRQYRVAAVADAPVTVAIVSWNTRDLLDRCLRSLEAYRFAELADVWVVDNASSDGSPELVRERRDAILASREARAPQALDRLSQLHEGHNGKRPDHDRLGRPAQL